MNKETQSILILISACILAILIGWAVETHQRKKWRQSLKEGSRVDYYFQRDRIRNCEILMRSGRSIVIMDPKGRVFTTKIEKVYKPFIGN